MTPLATDRIPASVIDCDRALVLLRTLCRTGTVPERRMARIATDDVLDRRHELTRRLEGRRGI